MAYQTSTDSIVAITQALKCDEYHIGSEILVYGSMGMVGCVQGFGQAFGGTALAGVARQPCLASGGAEKPQQVGGQDLGVGP